MRRIRYGQIAIKHVSWEHWPRGEGLKWCKGLMDILNFQSENPSGVDVFKGESHDRVAQAMHDYIKSKNNHRVIGLDGEFGSGKSSILQMLEKKISLEGSNTKLWIFDCEQNYQGSIKSNFIELFTDQITSLLKDLRRDNDVADVVKNRDIALGRHFSWRLQELSATRLLN